MIANKYVVNVQFLVDAEYMSQAQQIVKHELENANIYKMYPYNTAGDTGIVQFEIGVINDRTV